MNIEKIHKAIEGDNFVNTYYIGHIPFNWRFAVANYKGTTSRAAATSLLDEAVSGLLNIEDGLSRSRMGDLLGFTMEDNLELLQKVDNAEVELLDDSLETLKNKDIISGSESGYYLKEKGRILAVDGWMPEEVPITFQLYFDGLDIDNFKGAKVFQKWATKKTIPRTELLKTSLEELGIKVLSATSHLWGIDKELTKDQAFRFGGELYKRYEGREEFDYFFEESPYYYREHAVNLTDNLDLLKKIAQAQAPKAHCPEERCYLLADPEPYLVDVEEHGFQVVICILGNTLDDKIRLLVFDPATESMSDYLTKILSQEKDLKKTLLESWIKRNPQLADKVDLSERQLEIQEAFKKEQIEHTSLLNKATTKKEREIITLQINQGRKAFDEFEFEKELNWLFGLVKNELWLNFPRLRNQPLAIRIPQIEKALNRGVKIFLAYSEDYNNVDNMHDEVALKAYLKLEEQSPNFFMCKVDLSHKRTIIAIANDGLKFEYIPSYNIMSFSPYGIEEEIAKEINYRIPWDSESDKEYKYLREKFLDHYQQKFAGFFEVYKGGGYDFKENAKKNYERVEKEINTAFHWVEYFGVKEEIPKRVDRYLSNKLKEFVTDELNLLERNLNDQNLDSEEGKLPPRQAVGRLFSIESWAKKISDKIPPNTIHRCKVIKAGFYDSFPELKGKGNAKPKRKSNNNKRGTKKRK